MAIQLGPNLRNHSSSTSSITKLSIIINNTRNVNVCRS